MNKIIKCFDNINYVKYIPTLFKVHKCKNTPKLNIDKFTYYNIEYKIQPKSNIEIAFEYKNQTKLY